MSFFSLMQNVEAKKYWIALNMVPGVGAVTYRKLLNAFKTPEFVFAASFQQLKTIPGLAEKVIQNILTFGMPDRVARELETIERQQICLLTWDDPDYPELLKKIFDPPPVLYLKGRTLQTQEVMIAVVGSRKASTYGRIIAEKLCSELALKGVAVVSGMARGIDSASHKGALKAGGRTIAVMGCGVDVIYPPENRKLYDEIVETGAVLSEFPMHTKPDRGNFPARNRIISGMSLGTVVVEANLRSGALITADMALEQGREVFAVPGNINSASSRGTNRLIKQGAGLVEHAEDILRALSLKITQQLAQNSEDSDPIQPSLPLTTPTSNPLPAMNEDEERIYSLLTNQPTHIDELTLQAGLPSGTVSAMLMMLEMKNLVRQLAGKMFVRL